MTKRHDTSYSTQELILYCPLGPHHVQTSAEARFSHGHDLSYLTTVIGCFP